MESSDNFDTYAALGESQPGEEDSSQNLQPEANKCYDAEFSCDSESDYPASTADSRDRVFSNALIWRKLEKCLNLADLKCLRLVDREFNRNILDETNFKSRVLINMKASKIEQEVFKPTTLWKHFRIECFSEQDLYEDLSEDEEDDKIASLESLLKVSEYFVGVGYDGGSNDAETGEVEEKPNFDWIKGVLKTAETLSIITICDFDVEVAILPSLKELLEAPEKLKSLSLDVQTMDRNYNSTFKDLSDSLRSTLERLSEFHILPSTKYLEETYEEVIGFLKTTTVFSTVVKSLHVFTVPKFQNGNNIEGIKSIHSIVEENQAHLSSLEVAEPRIWAATFQHDSPGLVLNLTAMGKMKFSQLKSLKMVVHHVDDIRKKCRIVEFLKTQPLLERLELSISPKCPTDLCTVISTMGHLKTLRIRTKGFDASDLHSWAFLNKLEKLEEFHFVLGKSHRLPCRGISVASILGNLPKSVCRISIKGIPNGSGGGGNPEYTQAFAISDISRLNPLGITHLNLSQCSTFVSDKVMECICRSFGMLRHLDVSWNHRLTDFGFTGIKLGDEMNHSSFSIKDLKGLRYLKLERCGITDLTLVQSVHFLELIHLDLTDCRNITKVGCTAAIENNPSLEVLLTKETFSPEFRTKFPRLKPATIPVYDEDVFTSDDDLSDSDETLEDLDEYGNFDSDDLDGFSEDDHFGFHFRFGYDDYDDYLAAELDFDEW